MAPHVRGAAGHVQDSEGLVLCGPAPAQWGEGGVLLVGGWVAGGAGGGGWP